MEHAMTECLLQILHRFHVDRKRRLNSTEPIELVFAVDKPTERQATTPRQCFVATPPLGTLQSQQPTKTVSHLTPGLGSNAVKHPHGTLHSRAMPLRCRPPRTLANATRQYKINPPPSILFQFLRSLSILKLFQWRNSTPKTTCATCASTTRKLTNCTQLLTSRLFLPLPSASVSAAHYLAP